MAQSPSKAGIVYLIGAGPGDLGLITVRGLECLRLADVVIYDRLANPLLLSYAAPGATLIDAGKEPEHHSVPQHDINALLIEHALGGKTVARLKGGDPFVFGRGGEEAVALAGAGIPFEIVPGVSSAIAGPAYAGIPVTHRGLSCSVAFATGHRAAEGGDLGRDAACDWQRLADGPDTLVFLMGVHSLPRIAEELISHGRSPDTPAAVIAQATGPSQRTVTGTLAEIAGLAKAAGIRPPALIVVGEVVRLRESLRWFDLPERRPLLGQTVMVTATTAKRTADTARDTSLNPETGRTGSQKSRDLRLSSPGVADEIASRLAGLGAEVSMLELGEIVEPADSRPLDLALHEIAAPPLAPGRAPRRSWGGWLVFSSPEAVRFTLNRFFRIGYDARALAGCKIHAADAATTAALLYYGLRPDQAGPANGSFRPGQRALWIGGRTESGPLAIAPSPSDGPSFPVLDVSRNHTLSAGSVTPADLCGYGLLVTEVAAFTPRPAPVDRAKIAALAEGKFSALVVTSPLDARFLAARLEEAGGALSSLAAATVMICNDEQTAAQARRSGAQVDLVANETRVEDIINAVIRVRLASTSGG